MTFDPAADVIAALALILAVVSFIVTLVKAKANAEAAEHAQETADAARVAHEKAAAAAEEANIIARASLPSSPWDIRRSGNRLSIRNASQVTLLGVTVDQTNGDDLVPFDNTYKSRPELLPNQTMFYTYAKTYASPGVAELLIRWRESNTTPMREWRESIA